MWVRFTSQEFIEPLWPLFGVNPANHPLAVAVVLGTWVLSAFSMTVQPRWTGAGVIHAIAVFVLIAIANSDGRFGHNWYAFLFISLILALLPLKSETNKTVNLLPFAPNCASTHLGSSTAITRSNRHYYMMVFWGAQLVICTFYFLTGVWKIRSLIACAALPNIKCELTHKVLTNIAAQELIQLQPTAPLHQILFIFPWFGFVAYLGTIWLHSISLIIAFRPQTHLLFGTLRSIFHLGTFVLFGVNFSAMTAAVLPLFVFSPFHGPERPLWQQIASLPPLGSLLKILKTVLSPWPFSKTFQQKKTTEPNHLWATMRLGYGLLAVSASLRIWHWENLLKQATQDWVINCAYLILIFGTTLAACRPQFLMFRIAACLGTVAVFWSLNSFHFYDAGLGIVALASLLLLVPLGHGRFFARGFAWARIALPAYLLHLTVLNWQFFIESLGHLWGLPATALSLALALGAFACSIKSQKIQSRKGAHSHWWTHAAFALVSLSLTLQNFRIQGPTLEILIAAIALYLGPQEESPPISTI